MRPRFIPGPREQATAPGMVLLPRPAPPGKLRVWAGAFGRPNLPVPPSWRLDGTRVRAIALHGPGRHLRPVHGHGAQSYFGVFEFDIADDQTNRYVLEAIEGNRVSASVELQPFPERIPTSLQGEFRILMMSCFYRPRDNGELAAAVRRIPESQRPHLTLTMGDQVYLDLPALMPFPKDEARLARKFEERYRRNWATPESLLELLDCAPVLAGADDHEYWNNYPHDSPLIENSWSSQGRRSWKNASDALFDAFQTAHPSRRGQGVQQDVDNLSIFVLDQRTHRLSNRSATLAPGEMGRFTAWVNSLIASGRTGVVVTGQSLLDPPVRRLKGKVADWHLANYQDYAPVVRELERLADAGRPVILLTGDVHWSRVTEIRRDGRLCFVEVICSPSALVSVVGADQLKTLGNKARSIFGQEEIWYRHATPRKPPEHFAKQVFGTRYSCALAELREGRKQAAELKGNHLCTLGFSRHGSGLSLNIAFHPLDRRLATVRTKTIKLAAS